jgi:hypothetical protein
MNSCVHLMIETYRDHGSKHSIEHHLGIRYSWTGGSKNETNYQTWYLKNGHGERPAAETIR